MDPRKYSFYFDEGNIELETLEEKQITYIDEQLKNKSQTLHIPSNNKDWYIDMSKIKAMCIESLVPQAETPEIKEEKNDSEIK